jgi:hypothetical protein
MWSPTLEIFHLLAQGSSPIHNGIWLTIDLLVSNPFNHFMLKDNIG